MFTVIYGCYFLIIYISLVLLFNHIAVIYCVHYHKTARVPLLPWSGAHVGALFYFPPAGFLGAFISAFDELSFPILVTSVDLTEWHGCPWIQCVSG